MSFTNKNNEKLTESVSKIQEILKVDSAMLEKMTNHFLEMMEAGLSDASSGKGLPMIPSFVTGVPTGTEHGTFLAADLGGTNFRACSVTLNGDHTFKLEQSKARIPDDMLEAETSEELFDYLAKKTGQFLFKHHPNAAQEDHVFKLGFTFSYPVNQTSLAEGTLLRWTKGFKIADTVGRDPVQLYQEALDRAKVPIRVVALANDTVGTLLSHAYSSGSSPNGAQGEPVIGAIFGTGTNGCYLEKLENIKKLPKEISDDLKAQGKTHMVINTEWGSFDNAREVLPDTKWDRNIDSLSANPGFHLFEKRVSGMYLGEMLRNILVDLHSEGVIFPQYPTYDRLPHRLRTPFALDSEVLSHIEIDDSTNLKETELSLLQSLHLPTSPAERLAIQSIVRAISRRSAYLSAVPLAAILIKTDALNGYHKEVEIGMDGSVIEYYPGFRSMVRHALALSPIGADGERKVHICIAKDGSGVGAALCASVAV